MRHDTATSKSRRINHYSPLSATSGVMLLTLRVLYLGTEIIGTTTPLLLTRALRADSSPHHSGSRKTTSRFVFDRGARDPQMCIRVSRHQPLGAENTFTLDGEHPCDLSINKLLILAIHYPQLLPLYLLPPAHRFATQCCS